MGTYQRHIGPRIVHALCAGGGIRSQREKMIPLAEGVVVEFGIGSGLNLPFYDRAKVTKLIGLNPDDGFPDLGPFARLAGGLDFEFVAGSAEAAPFEDGIADTVVVTYTFCSVESPRAAMAEARRILKPGGRMILSEHGRSPRARVARWQDRVNPIWRPVAVGCNINRDHAGMLAEEGFDTGTLARFDLPGMPAVVGHHHQGVLTAR